jgi:acetylornithine deacetylase/succinyl-diaminopimelate desuccinylase-like protein
MTNGHLDSYIDTHFDSTVDLLKTFCAQPSVSAQNHGIREMAGVVRAALEARGLAVTIYETAGYPVVVGRASGHSPRTLMFYNHYDVQPAEPLDLWTNPPFEPTVRDGALYARGAGDDKGELVSRLAAFDAVKAAHDGELPCNVLFVVEGEEEIGSPNIAPFVIDHAAELACDGVLWEFGGVDDDDHPTGFLGLRGILAIELRVRTMSRDAHSGGAHALPSAAWRLVHALATLKDTNEHILIPGFYDGAQPISAEDLALLEKMPNHEAQFKAQYGIDQFLLGRTGVELLKAVYNPTCNIQGITTGYQGNGTKTVIPAEASAKIDFRLVPGQDPDDILDKLRAHLDAAGFADVHIEKYAGMFPHKDAAGDPLVQLAARTALDVYGKEVRLDPLIGGSGPAYIFGRTLGAPIIYAGVNYPNGGAHAPDEHVRLNDLRLGIRHVARILDGFAGVV